MDVRSGKEGSLGESLEEGHSGSNISEAGATVGEGSRVFGRCETEEVEVDTVIANLEHVADLSQNLKYTFIFDFIKMHL